jgi:C4-type Zn-finger protein
MNSKNPTCPYCGERMVFVAMAVRESNEIFRMFTCDCLYRDTDMVPKGIIADVVRAREWDDGSLSIVFGGDNEVFV